MSIKIIISLLIILIDIIPTCSNKLNAETDFYIRLNQIGFLPDDIKTAVVISKTKLDNKEAIIKEINSDKVIYRTYLQELSNGYGNFRYTYKIDFSNLRTEGEFEILINKRKSYSFKIGKDIYDDITSSLLEFFKVQRCGYTNPLLHDVCHIADATNIIDGKNQINKNIDVTGGWHDAGDYIKFLNTTAFSTYMLLFSYEFDSQKFGFDKDKNGLPDILEEAKVGLDWLLRCNYEDKKFITQVQDLKDHESEWRMPENDKYTFDRPAFLGIGKNLIGIYSATLALASRIWKEKFQYYEFADKCLNTAKHFYSIRNSVPNIDSSGTGMYIDSDFNGKLALAAIELFISTNNKNYYNDAINYADSAKNNFWWSWGDINPLVHYKLAKYDNSYLAFLKNNLDEFNKFKSKNVFGIATQLNWGSNNTLLGITLQNILWKRLTKDSTFDTLGVYQRDFIMGRNPWGISFIFGYGENYTKNFHHQISYFKKKLPGGFAAGPVSKKLLNDFKIQFEEKDSYLLFQTDEIYYRDDRYDYITNEPTITANATAIFVFGNMKN
ncbi:MAG: glycoside hydrolase family 9 protein [Melioribacter sp.]|uniref:glycoside hydrolase family 9 protein n=1 Tax=Rosettibacter primus TaxID=3111523 RepID=UPI00247BD43E|nr:glycoside hydrolase family 9 protein [Melioribacter sp.]